MMMKTNLLILFLLVLISASPMKEAMAQTDSSQQSSADAAHTLSEAQKQAIKRIQADSARKAAPVALRLAGVVNKIYGNMLADRPDEKLRARLSAEMRDVTWELLSIKGQAIREVVNVLTREQKQLIKSEMLKPGAPADLSELIARTFKLTEQ